MINEILTPLVVWKDFDYSLNLKSSTISELSIDGIQYKTVYFSGRQTLTDRVRIYGCYARSEGNTNATLLLVPDYSSTIDERLVVYFAKRGYNVLMIDIRGKFEGVENYTAYPKDVFYANYLQSDGYIDKVNDDAYHTAWYEWCACVRYAISFLLEQNKNAKIGLMGIKNGANVCWQVAATDDRIKASAFIMGAGHLAYKGVYKNVDKEPEMTDERFKFLAGVDMQGYAQFVKTPTLFLTTVNNREFEFERAIDTVARIPNQNDVRSYYIVDFDEVLDKNSLSDLNIFFEKYIKKNSVKIYKAPNVSCEYSSGKIYFDIKPDVMQSVKDIEVFYSFNNVEPYRRFWSRLFLDFAKEKPAEKLSVEIDALSGAESVLTFVNVIYDDGFAVSGKVFNIKLDAVGKSRVNNIIFGNNNKVYYTLECNKNNLLGDLFVEDEELVTFEKGPFDIVGISSKFAMKTNVLDLIKERLSGDTIIKFDVYAKKSATVEIIFKSSDGKSYSVERSLLSGEFWQNLSFSFSEFKDESSKEIIDFSSLMTLVIKCSGKIILNNLLVL